MIIDITFRIGADEGIGLNAVDLCHILQQHCETVLKDKARVLQYKCKVNDFNDYYPEDKDAEYYPEDKDAETVKKIREMMRTANDE